MINTQCGGPTIWQWDENNVLQINLQTSVLIYNAAHFVVLSIPNWLVVFEITLLQFTKSKWRSSWFWNCISSFDHFVSFFYIYINWCLFPLISDTLPISSPQFPATWCASFSLLPWRQQQWHCPLNHGQTSNKPTQSSVFNLCSHSLTHSGKPSKANTVSFW